MEAEDTRSKQKLQSRLTTVAGASPKDPRNSFRARSCELGMVLLLVGLSPMRIASTLTLHALIFDSSHRILVPPATAADLTLPVYPKP